MGHAFLLGNGFPLPSSGDTYEELNAKRKTFSILS
jgi:hypothetical protein